MSCSTSQAVLLSFSIKLNFSEFCMHFQYFSVFYKELHIIMVYVLNSPSFQYFWNFQYLWSEFSKKNNMTNPYTWRHWSCISAKWYSRAPQTLPLSIISIIYYACYLRCSSSDDSNVLGISGHCHHLASFTNTLKDTPNWNTDTNVQMIKNCYV